MTKILAVGAGPLIEGGVSMLNAHCLRTWNLVKPLVDVGHDVALFTEPIFPDRPQDLHTAGVEDRRYNGFGYRAFRNADDAENLARLEAFCREWRPECLLSIAAPLLTRLSYLAPLWADLFGHVVVEAQGKAHVMRANTHLHSAWEMERAMVRRADHISTCSRRQGYAVYGELGAIGRMNWQNFRSELISVIPPAFDPFHAASSDAAGVLRGKIVPENAFVLLWSGGYNTWTNIDALFGALELAMEACADLHYVSTGGSLYAFDEVTYPRFERMVAQSRFRERFHLLGWVDARELPGIYVDADLALCVDSRNLETMFGTRTRIMNLLASGLPVLATRGSEIVEDLEAVGCLRVCEPDDPQALSASIVDAAKDRTSLRSLAEQARTHALANYNFQENTRPLQHWALAPHFAPDNAERIARAKEGGDPFAIALSPMESPSQAEQPKQGRVGIFRQWLGLSTPPQVPEVRELLIDIAKFPDDVKAVLDGQRYDRLTLWPAPEAFEETIKRVGELDRLINTPIRLQTSGLYPGALEATVCALLDQPLNNSIEAALEVRGLESTQNAYYGGHQAAWWNLLKSAALLRGLPSLYPGRFTLVALVILSRYNAKEIESLGRLLGEDFGCRLEFRLAEDRCQWPLPGTWRGILDALSQFDLAQGTSEARNIRRQLVRK